MPEISDKAQVVKVVIFGEEYTVRGSDDPEYIFSVASFLDKRMNEIASKNKSMPPTRVAVLTALNLAGELFDEQKKNAENISEVENRAKNILNLLESKISFEDD